MVVAWFVVAGGVGLSVAPMYADALACLASEDELFGLGGVAGVCGGGFVAFVEYDGGVVCLRGVGFYGRIADSIFAVRWQQHT